MSALYTQNSSRIRARGPLSWELSCFLSTLHLVWYPSNDHYILNAQPIQVSMRLGIAVILQAKSGDSLIHFGLKCSSFTPVNQATSSRSPCSAFGDMNQPSVRVGNMLASRRLGAISHVLMRFLAIPTLIQVLYKSSVLPCATVPAM